MIRMFAPLTKVDEEKRLVWGRLAHETPDRSGEIFDYISSKPYFKAWSEEFAKATAATGQEPSLGNLRAMHSKVAAGKFTVVDFNDVDKAVDVCAKVVDDNEWKKVLEGVYTGFSIGGDYVGDKKAEKVNGKTFLRYTGKPTEGSLVDSPCIPTAKFFEIQKADGTTMQKAFRQKTDAERVAEENAKVEKIARKLARKAYWKLSLADRATIPTDVFNKMSAEEQRQELSKRSPDYDWENHVGEAIRVLKKQAEDEEPDEDELEKPEDVSQEDWDGMTYEEKLECCSECDKAAAAALKKAEDEKDLVKPEDVDQDDWDEMTGEEKRKRIEEAAAKAGKAAKAAKLAKAEAEEMQKEAGATSGDPTDASPASTATVAEAEQAAKAAGASTADLSAVEELAQLLDKGAVTPEQLLSMAKREFSQEERDKLADTGAALPDGSFPIKTVQDLKNAVQAYGRAKDKEKAKAHIISRAKSLGATDELPEDWRGSTKEEKAAQPEMKKGLSNVAQFASALQALSYICASAQNDADLEGDNSPVPGQLRGWLSDGAAIFKSMAAEEVDELVEELGSEEKVAVATLARMRKLDHLRQQLADPNIRLIDFRKIAVEAVGEEEWKEGGYFQKYVEDQAGCIEAILTKAGARHSKEDLNHLQSAHDHLCAMGAKCNGENLPEAEKSTGHGALLKQAMESASTINQLQKSMDAMRQELDQLKNQPVPAKGVVRFISKGADTAAPVQPDEAKLEKDVTPPKPGVHDPEYAAKVFKQQVQATSHLRKL